MPLSPTLFGLCIDELEEMVVKFVREVTIYKREREGDYVKEVYTQL